MRSAALIGLFWLLVARKSVNYCRSQTRCAAQALARLENLNLPHLMLAANMQRTGYATHMAIKYRAKMVGINFQPYHFLQVHSTQITHY